MPVARRKKLLLIGLTWLGLLSAAPAASAARVSLRYWGGPVAHSMNVYLVQWGAGVRSTYTDTTSGDPAFFNYLASQSGTTTDLGGVLAQYMDTSGANSQNRFSYGGMTQITPPASGGTATCALPTCVDDSVIQSQLGADITGTSPSLPSPAGNGLSTLYVILFPPNVNVCQGGACAYDTSDGFCSYHSSFPLTSSTQVLYAAIVDNGPGTPNDGECGTNDNDIDNQTTFLSHEFAESINDPLGAEATENGPPLGWYDTQNGEVADICENATDQAQDGPWTVQKIWSNRDRSCVAGETSYSAPTASFVGDTTATPDEQLSFDASASSDPSGDTASAAYSGTTYSLGSGIASYTWDWGDGSANETNSTPTATHVYASDGTYNASLTVTDDLGFTSTVTQQVVVSGPATPPVVSTGAASNIDSQDATLSGTINPENRDVQYTFLYGTSPTQLDQSTPLTAGPTGDTPSTVSATLSGLTPSTPYYYELEAVADGENYTNNDVQTFTTSAAPPPAAQTPLASTGPSDLLGATSAQLQGAVNPNGAALVTYWFAYGTSPTNLNLSTPQSSQPGGTTFAPVSANLSGLAPATTYYYALEVSLNGTTTPGTVNNLTTLTPPPSVATGAASAITSTSATVAGSVNPGGVAATYQVQFGPTANYGYSTAPLAAAGASRPVSVPLTGLRPGTTYHYRLVASNAAATVVGADGTFTTAKALAAAPGFSFHVLGHPRLPRALHSGVKVRFTCSQACTAHFSVVVLPGKAVLRVVSVPLSVASGTARLRAKGSKVVVLTFSRKAKKRLKTTKLLSLSISGVAGASGTATSSPFLRTLTLRRV